MMRRSRLAGGQEPQFWCLLLFITGQASHKAALQPPTLFPTHAAVSCTWQPLPVERRLYDSRVFESGLRRGGGSHGQAQEGHSGGAGGARQRGAAGAWSITQPGPRPAGRLPQPDLQNCGGVQLYPARPVAWQASASVQASVEACACRSQPPVHGLYRAPGCALLRGV